MPAAPFWQDVPDAWDTIVIAGSAMPGLAMISGDGIGRNIDLKSSPGRDGARLRDRGYQNAKFQIELRVWTKDQFDELQRRLGDLQPRRRGGTRNPLDVAHPTLSILGVTAMYVEGIGMPAIKGGVLSVTLKAIEWYQSPRQRPHESIVDRVNVVAAQAQAIATISAFEAYEAARQRPPAGP